MSSASELGLNRLIECDYNSHIDEKRLNHPMKIAAVSKFRAHLRNYLNQVKAGTEVLITDRGKPVARLVPISRTKTAGESLTRMEKQGLIKLGSGKLPKNFWTLPRGEDPQGLVLKALLEEREEGR